MEGRDDTPWDVEHTAGQSDANTRQEPQPQGPGSPGAPLEAAPLHLLLRRRVASAGRALEIPH
eukprot:1262279-Heterocapsa_arctica.AAC.1